LTTDASITTVSREEASQEKKRARINEHNTIVDLTTESVAGTKSMISRTNQLFVEGKSNTDQFQMLKTMLDSGAITQTGFNEEAVTIYASQKAIKEDYVQFKEHFIKSDSKRIEKVTDIRLPTAKKLKIDTRKVSLFPVVSTPPNNFSSSSSSTPS
jgi:hypothetical protein